MRNLAFILAIRVFSQNALHEGTGHDDHQDSCRIEHIVSLVHIVFLRQFVVELQVKRRIADDNIETLFRIVLPDVAFLDMGFRVEVFATATALPSMSKP